MQILDKNLVEIRPGQRLSVTHCIGPYGRTQTDVGTVESVDPHYRGVTIKLEKQSRREFRGVVTYLNPGDSCYLALAGRLVGAGQSACFVAERTIADFEHGHTSFAEVLPA